MTTKLGELRTYYQRNWEATIPSSTVGHVAGLALPFVGLLYKPAGRAISFTTTSLSIINSGLVFGLEFRAARLWNSRTYAHIWDIVKNGAELIGTVSGLRIGLAIHTVMNLGENFYELREWNGEKIFRIVSNALYLLTLVSFSNPVSYGIIGISLIVQACLSLRKAHDAFSGAKTWTEMKILDAAAHVAMALIFTEKSATAFLQCIEQETKIPSVVPRTFVLMQSLRKLEKENFKWDNFQNGKDLAESIMPAALNRTVQQNGKKHLVFYTAPKALPEQTVMIVLSIFAGYAPPHTRWAIFPQEKLWVTSSFEEQGTESPAEVASRVDGVIREILRKESEGDYLPVIVTGGTAIPSYLEAEIRKNPEIPANVATGINDGDMRVVTMTPNEMGDLDVTQVIAVDPK
jgi:hypothetical protein